MDSSSYFEIRNKTGFMLKMLPIPRLSEDFTGKDYNKFLEEEINRLKKRAKVRDIEAQDSDMPYWVARIDTTELRIKGR